jgi:fucose permease
VAAALLIWRAPDASAWSVQAARTVGSATGRLGLAFWTCLGMLFCTVAVEFATSFWAVDLLRTHKGLAAGAASAAFATFVAGMAVSRWRTPRLARRWTDRRLQAGSLVLALAGWALLWQPEHPAPAVAGLAVLGLGAGLHFPIGITLLMQAAPSRPDTATGYASVAAGLAAGSAPFVLGAVADRIGPHQAFLIVPVLLFCAGGLLLVNRRAALQEYLSARRELLIPAPKRSQT